MAAFILPALIYVLGSTHQLTKVPAVPMIRFTGREGGHDNGVLIAKTLMEIPYDPPNPQILPDNSIAFVEKGKIFAVFDNTYRPLRAVIAKNQLVNLILANGPQAALRITQLPFSLYDDLIEAFDNSIPEYEVTQGSYMTVSLNMQTSLSIPNHNLNLNLAPGVPESEASKAANDLRDNNPVRKNDAHAQYVTARELMYEKMPIVKIFSNGKPKPTEFTTYEKRAIRLFEDWVQKENFNIDQKLFNGLERMNMWSDKAAIFRTKVMSDLQSTSPGAYKDIMGVLTKDYERFGFTNVDAFREAITSASTNSTMAFNISVMLSDKKTVTIVKYPF